MALGVQEPARLGRYELLARLATGGMGEIFLARLEGAAGFEKLFVVKRILPHLADDPRFRTMLIAEARIASKLSHANICQVYELGETDGQLYIVMEYLEGITVLPLLRKASKEVAALEFGFVAGVIQQVADALHYAHELRDRGGEPLGIVHRDVTPSNVFLTDAGVVKVLDFGIAKVKDASTHTQTGTVKGKYAYMAPEQLRGISIDRRADVFALGVVIFELLALRRLFQRKTDYLTFRAVMEQPIPDVRRYRPDVPEAIAPTLATALDRDPNNRFESTRQLATAMIDALGALTRPWTQGEIGDYVRENFGDVIGKRSSEVTTAIHHMKSGDPRATMPLIAPSKDPELDDDDDDDEFPPVESTVSDAAPPAEAGPVRPVTDPRFHGQTPQPFAADSSASVPRVEPVVAQRRSLVLPLFAIAMVVIAGGALFLVWRQQQLAPPQPSKPKEIIGVYPDNDRYETAVLTRKQLLDACMDKYPVTGTPFLVVDAQKDGTHGDVALEPTSLNSSPLRACVKQALSGVQLPTGWNFYFRMELRHPNSNDKDRHYKAVLTRRKQLDACLTKHPVSGSPFLIIGARDDGTVRDISLEPTSLNGSALHACVKDVLAGIQLPIGSNFDLRMELRQPS